MRLRASFFGTGNALIGIFFGSLQGFMQGLLHPLVMAELVFQLINFAGQVFIARYHVLPFGGKYIQEGFHFADIIASQ